MEMPLNTTCKAHSQQQKRHNTLDAYSCILHHQRGMVPHPAFASSIAASKHCALCDFYDSTRRIEINTSAWYKGSAQLGSRLSFSLTREIVLESCPLTFVAYVARLKPSTSIMRGSRWTVQLSRITCQTLMNGELKGSTSIVWMIRW